MSPHTPHPPPNTVTHTDCGPELGPLTPQYTDRGPALHRPLSPKPKALPPPPCTTALAHTDTDRGPTLRQLAPRGVPGAAFQEEAVHVDPLRGRHLDLGRSGLEHLKVEADRVDGQAVQAREVLEHGGGEGRGEEEAGEPEDQRLAVVVPARGGRGGVVFDGKGVLSGVLRFWGLRYWRRGYLRGS